MADLYLTLLHYPVYDKTGAVVTTAVTNLDVHDLARLSRTFDVRGFYVCTPVETLQRLVARISRSGRRSSVVRSASCRRQRRIAS